MELIINNENGIYYGENRFWYASPRGTGPTRKVYALTPQEGVSGGDDGAQYTLYLLVRYATIYIPPYLILV